MVVSTWEVNVVGMVVVGAVVEDEAEIEAAEAGDVV